MPAPILLSLGLTNREWILLPIPVYSSWTYNEYTESMEPGRPIMSYLSPSEASNKGGVFNYIIFRLLAKGTIFLCPVLWINKSVSPKKRCGVTRFIWASIDTYARAFLSAYTNFSRGQQPHPLIRMSCQSADCAWKTQIWASIGSQVYTNMSYRLKENKVELGARLQTLIEFSKRTSVLRAVLPGSFSTFSMDRASDTGLWKERLAALCYPQNVQLSRT